MSGEVDVISQEWAHQLTLQELPCHGLHAALGVLEVPEELGHDQLLGSVALQAAANSRNGQQQRDLHRLCMLPLPQRLQILYVRQNRSHRAPCDGLLTDSPTVTVAVLACVGRPPLGVSLYDVLAPALLVHNSGEPPLCSQERRGGGLTWRTHSSALRYASLSSGKGSEAAPPKPAQTTACLARVLEAWTSSILTAADG